MAKSRTKRIVAIADPHCGHMVGLTAPPFQWKAPDTNDDSATAHIRRKAIAIQGETWRGYMNIVRRVRKEPVDLLVINGDAVDGKGVRSGGTEQITCDMDTQATMALACIKVWQAKRIMFIYGTPYHAGVDADWELQCLNHAKGDPQVTNDLHIGAHDWPQVNGVTFDFKHFIGSSSIPHGRYTALARDAMWQTFWAERELQPDVDIFVRSHVHYTAMCGKPGEWVGYITPALQAMGTKHGARKCTGIVDWGLYWWDIEPNGTVHFHPEGATIASQKAVVTVI